MTKQTFLFTLVCALVFLAILQVECAPGARSPKKLTPEEQQARLLDNWVTINKVAPIGQVRTLTSEEDFHKYLLRSPRNYTLVLLFSPERACYECRNTEQYFGALAINYGRQYNTPGNNLTSNTPLHFIHIPIERLYGVTTKLQIRSAPAIMVVPEIKSTGFPHKPEQVLYYHSNEEGITPYTLAQFILSRTGVEIAGYTKPLPWKFVGIVAAICIGLLPLATMLVLCPKSPWTWFYGLMIIYYLNMSGFVGNAVHDTPWFQYNLWTGERIWMHTSLQRQFRLEGFISGLLLVGVSFCLIGIVHFLPKIKSPFKQRSAFFFLLLLGFLFGNSWMSLYCQKNTFYPYKYYVDFEQYLVWGKATLNEFVANLMKH